MNVDTVTITNEKNAEPEPGPSKPKSGPDLRPRDSYGDLIEDDPKEYEELPLVYPYRDKFEAEDPIWNKLYFNPIDRWGWYDETVLVVPADDEPDKSEDFRRITDAMKQHISLIIVEEEKVYKYYNRWIFAGTLCHQIFLTAGWWSAVCVHMWPHKIWTWRPCFYIATGAFLIYNCIWRWFPEYNYEALKNDRVLCPVYSRVPVERFKSKQAQVYQLNYRRFRHTHQRSLFLWIFYNWYYYTKFPAPACTGDWACIENVPYYGRQYGIVKPPIEDAPKLKRFLY